jgi:hypothetical protein
MDDAAGWRQPDPELDPDAGDPGRSWDGDRDVDWDGETWADEVRVGGLGADFDRPPDHVPQLHRAMSEAAADLGAVEDRLSTLFDRTERPPGGASIGRTTSPAEGTGAETGTTAPAAAAVDGEIFDLFEDVGDEVEEADDDVTTEVPVVADRRAIIGEYEDDIGGDFAELDAELAAEEPDGPAEPKRRMFRRRAKGTTAAQR